MPFSICIGDVGASAVMAAVKQAMKLQSGIVRRLVGSIVAFNDDLLGEVLSSITGTPLRHKHHHHAAIFAGHWFFPPGPSCIATELAFGDHPCD